ncbi:hypothetical protein BURKHO8Y_210409 [Burkholderia sp. 8Y]|nr:hypothetical protein BURKHO8Y_210409 [Burkholderia sp. 8Y]
MTSFHAPPASASSRSSIGPSVLHGPHHGAQKSTSTGASIDALMTSFSNVARVVSMRFSSNLRAILKYQMGTIRACLNDWRRLGWLGLLNSLKRPKLLRALRPLSRLAAQPLNRSTAQPLNRSTAQPLKPPRSA